MFTLDDAMVWLLPLTQRLILLVVVFFRSDLAVTLNDTSDVDPLETLLPFPPAHSLDCERAVSLINTLTCVSMRIILFII